MVTRHPTMEDGFRRNSKAQRFATLFLQDVHAIRVLEHSYSLLSATPISTFLSVYSLPNFQYPRHFGKFEHSWQQHVEMPKSTWNHQWCHSQSCHFIQSLLSKSHTFLWTAVFISVIFILRFNSHRANAFYPNVTDTTEIPLNTLSNNSRTSYRISNPNNPYLRTGVEGHGTRKSCMGHKSYGYSNDIFEASPLKAWAQVKDHNLTVNGLPTLDQILTRKTRHPLSLQNFEDFLQQNNADANLACWREIYNHQKLWTSLHANIDRRKRRSEKESVSSFRKSKSSSNYASSLNTSSILVELQASQLSPSSYRPSSAHASSYRHTGIIIHTMEDEEEERSSHYSELADTLELLEDTNSSIFIPQSLYSWKHVDTPSMLCYEDLQQNAKRIYFKFCAPYKAETKIFLPDDYRLALQEMIEIHHLADPIIFGSSFFYIYEVLNIFFYDRFLCSVMYKNLSIYATRVYMTLSVLFLTIGFALEIACILTGYGTRATRVWGLIPLFLGYCALIASIEEFAWWLGFLNVRYVTDFLPYFLPFGMMFLIRYGRSFTGPRYHTTLDKAIHEIHVRRSWIFMLTSAAITLLCVAIFIAVPAYPITFV